jgi:hypothetical protein
MNFALWHPLWHFLLLLEDQPRSAYFEPLLTDLCHLRHSLRHILWCNNATASLGDTPVDVDLSKVFHSSGHENLLDSKGQFHPPRSSRSLRPGHSIGVCQFLASIFTPSWSKLDKCPVERPRYSSSGGMKHKNQRYFFIPSKSKHLHNAMPINDANPLQTKTKIKNYLERLSFMITLPRQCLFHDLTK